MHSTHQNYIDAHSHIFVWLAVPQRRPVPARKKPTDQLSSERLDSTLLKNICDRRAVASLVAGSADSHQQVEPDQQWQVDVTVRFAFYTYRGQICQITIRRHVTGCLGEGGSCRAQQLKRTMNKKTRNQAMSYERLLSAQVHV